MATILTILLSQLTKFHPLPSRLGGLRESFNTTRLLPMNCEESMYYLQPVVMLKVLLFAFAFVELCSRLPPTVATSDAP